MDTRPIGVFDSGLGGLTTVLKLKQIMPCEDIIYLGDTGRVPYGSRSDETITKYTRQAASFLSDKGIKALVIACNTACSAAYEKIHNNYDIPIYEVITAPAKKAANLTKNGKIGVIGTAATIRSDVYKKAIMDNKPDSKVYSVKCPLFVPLVENGRTGKNDIAANDIANSYLHELKEAQIDTLILGCTHYPLLRSVIQQVMGENVNLVDSGAETAKLVAQDIIKRGMASANDHEGKISYYVTDSIEGFSDLASRFMEENIYGSVEQVSLD